MDPTTDRPPAERPARVVGTALALLVVAAAVALLVVRPTAEVDGAQLVARHFEVEALPFGFETVAGRRLALGERVVVLADPDDWRALELPLDPEPEPTPETEGEQREGGGDGAGGDGGGGRGRGRAGPPGEGWKPGPWASLELGEEGAPPREAALVWYPSGQAEALLRRQFGDVRFQDVGTIDQHGGSTPVDSGYLDWHGYRAGFVLVRTFQRRGGQPTFRDRARVNVSVGGTCCVLYVGWPWGERGSRGPVDELLAALVPRAASS